VKHLEAVFFDLDGLLADTEGFHILAYEAVGRHLKIDLSEEYISTFIGAPTRENVKTIMKDFNIPAERFGEILQIRYNNYMNIVKTIPLSPMDGAIECIERVREKGYRTALVTSSLKEHSLAVLENISRHSKLKKDIDTFFNIMVFGDDIEQLKPAPDIYHDAVKRLQLVPDSIIALEDSEAGVVSAKRAGLYVIAVPGPQTNSQNFSRADTIVSSLYDILAFDFLN